MRIHICAGLFLTGLLLMIGKAGACDLGAGLWEVIPGVLAGMALMAAGAYGLRLEDMRKSAEQARRADGRERALRTGFFAALRMTGAQAQKKGPAAGRPQSHARENNSMGQVYPIFSEKSRGGRKA